MNKLIRVKAHRAKLYLSEKDLTAANTSSEVSAPRIISINFMIGGGLKKCMPITCSMEITHFTILKRMYRQVRDWSSPERGVW